MSKSKHYLLVVIGDVEPTLVGPVSTKVRRDRIAHQLRIKSGGDDGIFTLDVNPEGCLEIGSYSGAYLQGEDNE